MAKRRKKAKEKEVVEEQAADTPEDEVDDVEAVADGDLAQDDDEESADGESADGEVAADAKSDSEASDEDSAAEGAETEVEEEEPVGPDDEFSVEQLKSAGCRVDINENGNAWRVFLYDRHTNAQLNHTIGLPGLKELWVMGSRVTETAVTELQKELPKTKIYS